MDSDETPLKQQKARDAYRSADTEASRIVHDNYRTAGTATEHHLTFVTPLVYCDAVQREWQLSKVHNLWWNGWCDHNLCCKNQLEYTVTTGRLYQELQGESLAQMQ